jgi:hypothetical protein
MTPSPAQRERAGVRVAAPPTTAGFHLVHDHAKPPEWGVFSDGRFIDIK